MRESLADSLAIPARDLPAILVSRAERARLQKLAARLAPVHCGGFEIRLNGARGRVDLQQRIRPCDSEPRRLAGHLHATGLCVRPAWGRIHAFASTWPNRSLAGIGECWLEYEPGARGLAAPSVFVSLARNRARADSVGAVRQALALLAPRATARRFARAVRAIANRLPAGTRIFDVGLLARRPAALRINVGGMAASDAGRVLAALSFGAASQAQVVAFAQAVEPVARRVKLALDWRGGLLPRVGLEIYPGEDAGQPPAAGASSRWIRMLALLRARGCCDARVATALAIWPGRDEPPGCRLPWPESLMVESLLRGPAQFSTIDRRLSHAKVDFVPGQRPAAKAYFGFESLWRSVHAVGETRTTASRLRDSIARATAFLLAQRQPGGGWHDFADLDGGSGEWLSAYAAAALAGTARRAALGTWLLLARYRARPGWGYNLQIPVDADSSLWALRLAAAVDRMGDPAAKSALSLLRGHRFRDGGVATFVKESLGISRPAAGWRQAHAEVTAAAGALPGFARSSAAWLLRRQRSDGCWSAYWYDEDAFATALAAEHLATRRGPTSRRARMRAARWAAARVAADGAVAGTGRSGDSAFAAACCLRILLAAPQSDATRAPIGRLCRWLAAAQRVDGGWPGSAPLRLPLPEDTHPRTFGARLGFARDAGGIFTTATVLEALARLARVRR